MRRRVIREVLVCVLLTVLLVVAIEAEAPTGIMVPLGLLVAFGVPGWLGFVAVRGRRPGNPSEAAAALLGSVGTLAALGIVLNLATTGLTPTSWSVAVFAIAVLLAPVAALRVLTTPSGKETHPAKERVLEDVGVRRVRSVLVPIIICLGLLIVGAIVTVTSQRQHIASQHLTELWLTSVAEHETVHVRNDEGATMQYRLVVTVAGKRHPATTLTLGDGLEWTTTIEAPLLRDEPSPFAASLYFGDDPTVYREVHLNRPPA
jgi:hypothetical protein